MDFSKLLEAAGHDNAAAEIHNRYMQQQTNLQHGTLQRGQHRRVRCSVCQQRWQAEDLVACPPKIGSHVLPGHKPRPPPQQPAGPPTHPPTLMHTPGFCIMLAIQLITHLLEAPHKAYVVQCCKGCCHCLHRGTRQHRSGACGNQHHRTASRCGSRAQAGTSSNNMHRLSTEWSRPVGPRWARKRWATRQQQQHFAHHDVSPGAVKPHTRAHTTCPPLKSRGDPVGLKN